MKFGVLTFSYANFKIPALSISQNGFFSANIGDYMQTIAVRRLYRRLGICDEQILDIDRDTISEYSGEPVALLMCGYFFPWSFPLPEKITPIFIGFQTTEPVIKQHAVFFKEHEPIGCRDRDTVALFDKYGISAFASGCVTMTFEKRVTAPDNQKVLLVSGAGAGAFPLDVLSHMPRRMLQTAEIVCQRKIVHSFPLSAQDMSDAEGYASYLLRDYRERATLIVTPLHHAATPCLASGIPVIICRKKSNSRFSLLRELTDIYTPDRFAKIDWGSPPAVELPTASFINHVASAVKMTLR